MVQESFQWAMAGRSQEKLERLRSQLSDINPACAAVPIITAELTDSKSLDKLAKQSDVIISVAGPFWKLGLPLVCPSHSKPGHSRPLLLGLTCLQ
jgi:short subunit dehydrogenase-like uncharacterized protein